MTDVRLRTLKGRNVVFTGVLSVVRAEAERRARRTGKANVADKVSAATDVVVQGRPSSAYKWGDTGTKLERVAAERGRGHPIYVITETEFNRLLSGKPLSLAASEAALDDATSVAGVPHRPRSGAGSSGTAVFEVDLAERERKLRAHCQTIERVASAASDRGYAPLDSLDASCAFDVGWKLGNHHMHIVEVKTINRASEVQQMRLGLGQVLEYRQTLRDQQWRVDASLVLDRPPGGKRVMAACEAVDVTVAWPSKLRRLF